MAAKQLPIHEDALPGHESKLTPKPDWQPRYPGSGKLADRVAIITGADSGIGRAVAALYAREGTDITVLYLCEHDDAAKTVVIVESEDRKAIAILGDVGDKKWCEKAVAKVVKVFGRIDILVNNAGEQDPDQDIMDITEAQLRRTFQTNIFGIFFLTQAAHLHLAKGASIINCSRVNMYEESEELLDYSRTKGAITAFTRSLSANWLERASALTPLHQVRSGRRSNPFGGASKKKLATFGKKTPMKQPGQPNEVAPSFLFLACDDASYTSGQVLHLNGGTIVNG